MLGLDFDNTIVSYHTLFHALAAERGLIPADLPADKTAVRDHLRAAGREDDWTELQGLAYGPQLVRARPFLGVLDFIKAATHRGVEISIVSHKTRHPYRGEPHDLHAAARGFLALHKIDVPVFLELTKEAKLQRIAHCGFSHFVDDLPEFLTEPGWPTRTRRVLFDPADVQPDDDRYTRLTSWPSIGEFLLSDPAGPAA